MLQNKALLLIFSGLILLGLVFSLDMGNQYKDDYKEIEKNFIANSKEIDSNIFRIDNILAKNPLYLNQGKTQEYSLFVNKYKEQKSEAKRLLEEASVTLMESYYFYLSEEEVTKRADIYTKAKNSITNMTIGKKIFLDKTIKDIQDVISVMGNLENIISSELNSFNSIYEKSRKLLEKARTLENKILYKKENLRNEIKMIESIKEMSNTIHENFLFHVKKSEYLKIAKFKKDKYSQLKEDLDSIQKRINTMEEELNSSYSTTLLDMKTEEYFLLLRYSWNKQSEHPSINEHVFEQKQIITNTNRHILKQKEYLIQGEIANNKIVATDMNISANDLESFKIDLGRRLAYEDNLFTLKIRNTDIAYYHKYLIEKNGELSEVWSEVSEEVYEDNLDNLGMTLFAQPKGYLKSEKMIHAAPAGMQYVGNPEYGKWVNNSSGGSFWEFYGKYAMFRDIMGMAFSRNDYNSWDRDYRGRSSYYGGGSYGTYGSRTKNTNTFLKSKYRAANKADFNNSSENLRGKLRGKFRGRAANSKLRKSSYRTSPDRFKRKSSIFKRSVASAKKKAQAFRKKAAEIKRKKAAAAKAKAYKSNNSYRGTSSSSRSRGYSSGK